MPMEAAVERAAVPAVWPLAGDAVLIAWDAPGRLASRVTPLVGGLPAPRPHVSLAIPTADGGTRVVAALRWPRGGDAAAPLELADGDGRRLAAIMPPAAGQPDLSILLVGLQPAGRVQLVRLLLDFCAGTYAPGRHPGFAGLCRRILGELVPDPAALGCRAEIAPGLLLCLGLVPRAFGPVVGVAVIGSGTVRRNAFQPATESCSRRGQVPFHLVIDAHPGDEDLLVVLLGRSSLACRRLRLGDAARPSLLEWLEREPAAAPLRDYLTACLGAGDAPARAALAEMDALYPLPRRAATVAERPLGAEIGLAASIPGGGLFVAGWLHDPHQLVAGLAAVSPDGARHPCDRPWHRFARDDVARHYGVDGRPANGQAGFVTFLPAAMAPRTTRQQRFELTLRSGARIDLMAAPAPTDFADARNAVLGAMPPVFLTPAALEHAVAPAAAALHAAFMGSRRPGEVVDFGPRRARPRVSIVIPLYRVLDFLRFQVAALAVDPSLAEDEAIFVLDSPEQRHEVEHLLTGLHALYGLPLRLVVMPRNYGFAAASNAGLAVARGRAVLFLNSDVIPDRPGWMGPLLGALEADARLGAVGPKLLFADDSLQHAGLCFGRDLHGRWLNMHYHKGMPRDFAPANVARAVPAVTGAALLAPRRALEAVGGFTEDYIIGDYEDSDLCLKLRRQGLGIGYVPAAELYHLERQSIRRHDGYMRGAACEYNRRLHTERWAAWLELLMATPAPAAPPPVRKAAGAKGAGR